jgi:hypothetical protein
MAHLPSAAEKIASLAESSSRQAESQAEGEHLGQK